jgi:hypothetical protein
MCGNRSWHTYAMHPALPFGNGCDSASLLYPPPPRILAARPPGDPRCGLPGPLHVAALAPACVLPVPGARGLVPARAALVVGRLNFSLISFNFGLINVLCRTLRRATIYLKFRFISMLRRALRRAMTYFNFKFISVLHRVLRRVTVHLKFSLFDVWRRASSRATFRF